MREPTGVRLEGVDLIVRSTDRQRDVLREPERVELGSAGVVGDDAQREATRRKQAEQLVGAGPPAAAQVSQGPPEDPFLHHRPQPRLVRADLARRPGVLQLLQAPRRPSHRAQLLTRAPEGHDPSPDLEGGAAVTEREACPFESHEQPQRALVVEGAVDVEEDAAQAGPGRTWSARAHGETTCARPDSLKNALLRNHFSAGMSM